MDERSLWCGMGLGLITAGFVSLMVYVHNIYVLSLIKPQIPVYTITPPSTIDMIVISGAIICIGTIMAAVYREPTITLTDVDEEEPKRL